MGLFKEFRDFAVKGNVVDMAVGIIIGAAFGKIVGSLVEDVMMPPLGWAMGQMDFSSFALTLKDADAAGKGAVTIKYGMFINALINFVIVAFALFILIKAINAAKRQEAAAPPPPAAPPAQEVLLGEIRDILKARK
ncbi:MAG: large-conductance mechanosensitive channel protein MscL [Phycisphaerae bacterium]